MVLSIDAIKSQFSKRGGIARTNKFFVSMPSGQGLLKEDLNLLCTSTSIPGKQILTSDRRIGMYFEKIAYGYAVTDVDLNFVLTNDFSIRQYFETWKNLAISEDISRVKYKKDYARDVKIFQLKDGGEESLHRAVYGVHLIDAFPTTIQQIQYNNGQDEFLEVSVQLSYTNFKVIPETELPSYRS
jgi:hypothetical protein